MKKKNIRTGECEVDYLLITQTTEFRNLQRNMNRIDILKATHPTLLGVLVVPVHDPTLLHKMYQVPLSTINQTVEMT